MSFFTFRSISRGLIVSALLIACSPTFNWREVSISGDLTALLPCKPDRATRELPLGDAGGGSASTAGVMSLEMAGCPAGGATFAVAQAQAGSPAQAAAWLTAWQAATRAQWPGAQIVEGVANVPRAATAPMPLRFDISAVGPDGRATQAHVVWFARAGRSGSVALYQAMVLGQPSASDAAEAFFDGLHLQ